MRQRRGNSRKRRTMKGGKGIAGKNLEVPKSWKKWKERGSVDIGQPPIKRLLAVSVKRSRGKEKPDVCSSSFFRLLMFWGPSKGGGILVWGEIEKFRHTLKNGPWMKSCEDS